MSNICPVCEIGELTEHVLTQVISYKKTSLSIAGFQYCLCHECGHEPILPRQAKQNMLLIADAKRNHDGLLTSSQIKAIREKLGLTQHKFSQILCGNPNYIHKYETGEVIQSSTTDNLLRLVRNEPKIIDTLAKLKSRGAGAVIHQTAANTSSAGKIIQFPFQNLGYSNPSPMFCR